MRKRAEKRRVEPDDREAAREKCLRLLARRARSKAELRQALLRTGFEEAAAEEVLSDLEEAGLVDDEEFARSWVAARSAAGGSGRHKLSWELSRKGIARDLIARVLEEDLDAETELRQAGELARKRIIGAGERPDPARLRRYLLGRGYGFETVDIVLETVMKETEH